MTTGGAMTTRHPRAVLALVSAAVFMAMLDNLAVTNALPSIGEELHVNVSGLQWVVAGYTLVLSATLLSGGAVGDRLGQRRAFLCGLLGFMAGSALSSVATGWAPLVAGRAVQGLGAAVLLPAGAALLRHVFPGKAARARALGMRGAAGGLGVALGPAVGGPLVDTLGWRSVMWINLPVGAVALLIALWALPHPPAVPTRRDPAGQALAAAGLGSFVYALVQGPVDGWSAPGVLGALALSAVALPAFVAVERRVTRPLLDLTLFRDRACRAVAVSCFTSSVGLFGALFFLTLYLQDILGWSASGAGAVILSATAFMVLSAPAAGLLTVQYGPRGPLVAGLALNAFALLGISCYGVRATYASYGWLLPVMGAGIGLLFVPAAITVVESSPAARANAASAVVDTLREVGGVVGVAALGAVLTARMRATLYDRATDAGLPREAAEHLVRTVVTGGHGHGPNAQGADPVSPSVTAWVAESFVDGLHLALRCAAFALLGTLVLVLILLRRRRTRPTAPVLPLPYRDAA
ncbi:MFS transporter [Streptomyces syringium]|uniref:MFS transporter n=1 Tax=Streptomyces syringium TaxID=76729 RepID=UPI0037CF5D01